MPIYCRNLISAAYGMLAFPGHKVSESQDQNILAIHSVLCITASISSHILNTKCTRDADIVNQVL